MISPSVQAIAASAFHSFFCPLWDGIRVFVAAVVVFVAAAQYPSVASGNELGKESGNVAPTKNIRVPNEALEIHPL